MPVITPGRPAVMVIPGRRRPRGILSVGDRTEPNEDKSLNKKNQA